MDFASHFVTRCNIKYTLWLLEDIMSKKFAAIALGLATMFIPTLASASGSVLEDLDNAILDLGSMDASSLALDIDAQDELDLIAKPHGPRPGYHPGPRPGYRPPPPRPAPRYVPRRVHAHRTEIVVVEQPTTTVVETRSADTSESSASVERVGSRLGFGLRIIGNKQSDYKWYTDNDGYTAYDENRLAPGFGWYFKVRPNRWFSVEFQNDYQFGKLADAENIYRVPLTLGLRFHVFDYGDFDLYGVAAGALTIVSFDDCDGYGYDRDHYVQWGGQFGAGVSFIMGGFELGLDVRYTIDQAPDDHLVSYSDGVYDYTRYDQDQVVHGVTFALNIGFAL